MLTSVTEFCLYNMQKCLWRFLIQVIMKVWICWWNRIILTWYPWEQTNTKLSYILIMQQYLYLPKFLLLFCYCSYTWDEWIIIAVFSLYTGCHRRKGPNFGRVFLMLNYTDITQNTYIQSWTVTETMAREVWNFDSCYTLTDCQIHIETGRNMWFL